MALTDKAKLMTYLGVNSLKGITDDQLTWLINTVESHIAIKTGRKQIENGSLIEYHDGDGRSSYFITNEFPITSVSSLYDDVERDYDSTSLIDTDDYVWYREGRVELDSGSFSKGLKNIKIIYLAGYTSDDREWAQIEYLATKWVAMIFKAKDHLGISSQSDPDGSQTWFDQFLDRDMMSILNLLMDRTC